MSQQRQRKLSISSVSTDQSSELSSKGSSKCTFKGLFTFENQQTQVLLYEDSIAFSNLEGLNVLSFKRSMKFEMLKNNKDFIGFKIIDSEQYIFINEHWTNFSRWYQFLSKKLIQVSFHSNYSMVRLLGQGAFGKVYLASQISTSALVAVKMLSKSKTENIEQVLENEIKILRNIVHQNILELKGVFQNQEDYCIVMEYFEGVNLEEFLFENRLTKQQRKMMLLDLIETVEFLHSQKILHRDIKPSNILINPTTKQIKLIDFGVSVQFNHLKDYEWCGTLGYIAPESLKDRVTYKEQRISKIDVYSIGATFYEMIFNQRLHNGVNKEEIKRYNVDGKINFKAIECIMDNDELELLKLMLESSPKKRISLRSALNHRYLDSPQNKNYLTTQGSESQNPQNSLWSKISSFFPIKLNQTFKQTDLKQCK